MAAIGKVGSALMESVTGSGESRGGAQSELVRSIQAQNHVRKHREEEPVSGMINLSCQHTLGLWCDVCWCLVMGPQDCWCLVPCGRADDFASGKEMGSGGCGKAASSHVRREMAAVGEVVMHTHFTSGEIPEIITLKQHLVQIRARCAAYMYKIRVRSC